MGSQKMGLKRLVKKKTNVNNGVKWNKWKKTFKHTIM